ncbi:hypothetical protein ACJJTC_018904 [Scirpophaga incertulas]
MTIKKQLKITKLFRKAQSEDCDELQEEIQQLEQRLKEKQNELFQLQRNRYRNKPLPPKKTPETFIRPQKIVLYNSIENYKKNLEIISMLTGFEVKSYVAQDHCCIVYHMQHDEKHVIKHGLKIDMKAGSNNVSSSSLPVGYNLETVLEGFDNVMMPDCLAAIRKALIAYYDRIDQYEALKKMLNIEVQLFKIVDGSHIEISFNVQSNIDEAEDPINIVLMLDYRVYDIRPKTYSFRELDLPDSIVEAVRQQCMVFKRKSLHKAFKEAFIDGIGPYKLIQQVGPRRSPPVRRRQKTARGRQYKNNDDTFQPEECSEESDDDYGDQ